MISASTLADYARCDHKIFLDLTADPSLKGPPSEHLQRLWEDGRAHEAAVVATLPHVVAEGSTQDERMASTLDLMRHGVERIYHGFLAAGDLCGEPDFLERVEVASSLGGYSYIPVEVKFGKATTTRDGDTAKPVYTLQLCAYAELLEVVQALRPTSAVIIDDRKERSEIAIDASLWAEYQLARESIAAITQGREATESGYKTNCASCGWEVHCWEEMKRRGDLTTLPGIGIDKRTTLYQIGIRSVTMLADATPVQLTVKGISPKNRVLWPKRARALRDGIPELLRDWQPPASNFEISYDVETCDGEVYLHGILVRATGGQPWEPGADAACFGAFDPVYAGAGSSEEDVWRAFLAKVETLVGLGDINVYIYTPAEKTALRQLKAKYGTSDALSRFEERIIDLKKELCASVLFPTSDNGLKTLASFVDFHWRDQDPGGAQSIAWWKNYLADPVGKADQRDRVLAYNEDDTRATFALLDWYRRFAATQAPAES